MYIESDLLILERVTNWIESELILLYKSEHGNECFITLHCSWDFRSFKLQICGDINEDIASNKGPVKDFLKFVLFCLLDEIRHYSTVVSSAFM